MSDFIYDAFLKIPVETEINIVTNFFFVYIYDRIEPIREQIGRTKRYGIMLERHDAGQTRTPEPKQPLRDIWPNQLFNCLELPLYFFLRCTLR